MRKQCRGLSDSERVLVASALAKLSHRISIPCGGDRAWGNYRPSGCFAPRECRPGSALRPSPLRRLTNALPVLTMILRIRVGNSSLLHNFARDSRACPNRQKTWLAGYTVITRASQACSISFEALMPLKPTVHQTGCLRHGFWIVSDPRCFVGEGLRRAYEYCHTRQRLP